MDGLDQKYYKTLPGNARAVKELRDTKQNILSLVGNTACLFPFSFFIFIPEGQLLEINIGVSRAGFTFPT